ncbi:MAG: hypothetical protein WDN04_22395 [Rhodospirillales bacterium]
MDAPIASAAVTAFWSGSARELIATPTQRVVAELARHQVRHFRTNEAAQSPAWEESVAALQAALAALGPWAAEWHVLFEYPMLRLGMRIDAMVLTDRAILVLEFKRARRIFRRSVRSRITRSTCAIFMMAAGCILLFRYWSVRARTWRTTKCRCSGMRYRPCCSAGRRIWRHCWPT